MNIKYFILNGYLSLIVTAMMIILESILSIIFYLNFSIILSTKINISIVFFSMWILLNQINPWENKK